CDQDDAALEKRREQARQDHGVGYVRHREFVEAEHPGLFGERLRHRRDRIPFTGGAGLESLTMTPDAIMDVGHEVVEMGAPFRFDRDQLEEHVHEHGLAAADPAMDIKADDSLARLAAFG